MAATIEMTMDAMARPLVRSAGVTGDWYPYAG